MSKEETPKFKRHWMINKVFKPYNRFDLREMLKTRMIEKIFELDDEFNEILSGFESLTDRVSTFKSNIENTEIQNIVIKGRVHQFYSREDIDWLIDELL